jgi:hypothetical protein
VPPRPALPDAPPPTSVAPPLTPTPAPARAPASAPPLLGPAPPVGLSPSVAEAASSSPSLPQAVSTRAAAASHAWCVSRCIPVRKGNMHAHSTWRTRRVLGRSPTARCVPGVCQGVTWSSWGRRCAGTLGHRLAPPIPRLSARGQTEPRASRSSSANSCDVATTTCSTGSEAAMIARICWNVLA